MKLPLKAEAAIVFNFTDGPALFLKLESTWEGFANTRRPTNITN